MPATVETSGKVTRIVLSGEFDFSSQENLNQAFDKAIRAGTNKIILDLEKALFIDSSVIRLFLKLHDAARKNKKSLTLTHCNERIFEIFKIGGFDQVFDIQ